MSIIIITTMFTGIIAVCSLKGMSIPSFVLIGCCVNERPVFSRYYICALPGEIAAEDLDFSFYRHKLLQMKPYLARSFADSRRRCISSTSLGECLALWASVSDTVSYDL